MLSSAKVVFDFKSSYCYLAKDALYALEDRAAAPFEWLPWNFPLETLYGAPGQRTPLQENRVRYMYRDARRLGEAIGLVFPAPRENVDTTLAGIGALYARRGSFFRDYADRVFERFWKRELDVESPTEVLGIIEECGGNEDAFVHFLPEGRAEMQRIAQAMVDEGVFGVPTVVVGKELFWGPERFDCVEARLASPLAPSQQIDSAVR